MVKLPPQDAELQYRIGWRETAKRRLDDAKAALDAAAQQRNNIQAIYGPQLDYLKSAIPNQKINMRDSFEQASYAYSNGNKAGAKDFSEQGKQQKAELQQMYAQKEEALSQLKAAGEQFRQALDHHRACKAEFFAARDAVTERYDELKAENERKRKEREAQHQQRLTELKEQSARDRAARVRERQIRDIREASSRPSGSFEGANATVDGKNAVVERDEGKTNIYYGGQSGDPLGPGHGHIVTSPDSQTTYVREPGTSGEKGEVRTDDRKPD